MNKRWIVAPLAVLTIVFGVAAGAFAEPSNDSGQAPEREMGRERHKRLRERIEMMAMWRLTDVLDLDEKTAAKVFPMLREFNAEQEKLREKRRDIFKTMKAELEKKKPSSNALGDMIEEFKDNETEMVDLRNKKLDDLSKLLTDEQIAKMIVFVPEFERDVRHMIDDARTRRHERWERDRSRGGQELPPPPDLDEMEGMEPPEQAVPPLK